jgi:23S rRNA pseudouridine955/2504/2580 synthase
MSAAQILEVSEDDDGQRLDRWLKKNVSFIPYVLIQKLIRKGQIRVDGKKAKGDTRLVAGQQVSLPVISDTGTVKREKPALSDDDAQFIRSLVIFDDGHVIALNKPAGLAVQGGTNTRRHIDGMLDALKDKKDVRPRLVHRLDKDTSGVMLLARSAAVAKKLGDMFKGRDIRKTYWAIVTPTPQLRQGTIRAPLIKAGGRDREKVVVDEDEGKMAVTEYAVLEDMGERAAFVAFWPKTGRMHQIRVHSLLMGCPVLGDGKYGGQDAFIKGLGHAQRLHLHARRLVLPHPAGKGVLDIEAPLAPDLARSWRDLGFDPSYDIDPFVDIG